ncbi:integumentary mucin C.1-like [Coregonus clupeaformis]|uniref:integumentary mucin C.1-like n=1 Tax=Coregonus clupeaformis TaxID=59861 RepID=UPI001E1C82A4|nr:integumentary mucin C.1-like [Coregonus clupeaformis]
MTTTAASTSTTTIVLPTLTTTTATFTSTSMASVTSTTRFGTVMFFVRLMFQLNTPVPTKDDVLGVVDKQLYLQFNNQTNTQTTFQNGTYIKLTDTSFAVDLGFKITNVTMESQSNSLTLTNETYSQIEDSINSLLHDILCKPDGKQFDFPKPNFTTVGTQIRADVMYVYKKEDINLPSAFLEEVLKVSGLLPTTVAPTTTTTTVASTTAIQTAGPTTTTTIAAHTMTTTAASTSTTTIVLPTLTTTTATFTSTSMASVRATTRFGTVMFFVRLMFQLNTPVPTKDDVLGVVDKQLYLQFNNQTNTQTTFQNGTYIKLTDTSFAVDLGFKITNVTMESQSNSLTLTNETYSQIEDSINSLLHDILCKPDGKQFDFPKPNFTTVGTQIRADVMYVYKKEDINLPSAFLEEVLKVSGLLPTTVAPTTTTTTVASTTAIQTAGPTTTTTIAAHTMTTTAASTNLAQ